MKRGELVRELVDTGCYLKRHGKKHDIYANPFNGKTAPIPRHIEIKESLALLIKKQLGVISLKITPPLFTSVSDYA